MAEVLARHTYLHRAKRVAEVMEGAARSRTGDRGEIAAGYLSHYNHLGRADLLGALAFAAASGRVSGPAPWPALPGSSGEPLRRKNDMNSAHYLLYLLGRRDPITQATVAERACLRRHATSRTRLAELGVFDGVNTRAFREVMAPDARCLAVDPFPRTMLGLRGYGWARRIAHREVEGEEAG